MLAGFLVSECRRLRDGGVKELLAQLRALARRGRAVQIGPLQVADLTLNEVTHEVRRGARAIDLSPLEFRLLHCLMRHTGQALSRDAILDQVWNFDYAGGSNVVDVYMRYLRRKIEEPGELPLLHSQAGNQVQERLYGSLSRATSRLTKLPSAWPRYRITVRPSGVTSGGSANAYASATTSPGAHRPVG